VSVHARIRDVADESTWLQRSLAVGLVLSILWSSWSVPPSDLSARVVRDVLLFIVVPGTLAVTHGRRLGYTVSRAAVRDTLALALFVLPFYLVGSTLPSIRAYYPMWQTTTALGSFLPHAVQQLAVVVAAETYYRGLLCVGVSDEFGIKSIFISPVVYALHHVGKPPIELLLSGPTDVLFGAADYRSGSILPSVVAHGLGLLLLDWLALHDPLLPPDAVVEALRWLPVPL
jgi:membrane protease YdiL (CAAX protease family)